MATESPPVPDPTILTTEQLLREVHGLKELTESKIKAQDDICSEKFDSVNKQFALVERQRVEQKEDTKAAVDAAFSAAKEAVKEQTNASEKAISKSEGSTKEQLTQMGTTFTTAIEGVTSSLNDLKDRVTASESAKQGGKDAVASVYALIGAVAGALGIVGILAATGAFG